MIYKWFESDKLPKAVKILGSEWTIKQDPVPEEAEARVNGSTCYRSQEFWIDPDRSPDCIWRVYLHEIFHVLSNSLDMELTEHQILLLETGLSAFIKENGICIEEEDERD